MLTVVFCFWAFAAPGRAADDLTPVPGRWELRLENMTGFVTPAGLISVRENQHLGTDLSFRHDLGINTAWIPGVEATWWWSDRNSLKLQMRHFFVHGTATLASPVVFNDATLTPGTVHADTVDWWSLALYYQRRLTPSQPGGWDVRGAVGLEYTPVNFTLNGGAAPVLFGPSETKEDFNAQELPVPTLAVAARRRFGTDWLFEASAKGNYISGWDTLRQEGGEVFLTQKGLELHARAYYAAGLWGGLEPMVGAFYYYNYQDEESGEDGNRLSWGCYGPEFGLQYSF